MKARWLRDKADPPLKAICKAWPRLRELKFGDLNSLKRNFDPDLGVRYYLGRSTFEQEVKTLRKMDQEYLRAMHIVPIRPCMLTMSSKSTDKTKSSNFKFW